MPSISLSKFSKTGQTTSYATGDDGDIERGVEWPNPRFTDNLDGTVTDNLTGLIWLKHANCFALESWNGALEECNELSSGSCGLTDGSVIGDWRLPQRFELESLCDMAYYLPALPDTEGTGQYLAGNPFTFVKYYRYWSSTTRADSRDHAFYVDMEYGYVGGDSKGSNYFVWPVRGGQ